MLTARRINILQPTLRSLLKALPDRPAAFDHVIGRLARQNDPGFWRDLVELAGHHGVLGVVGRELTRHSALLTQVREMTERRLAVDALWQSHLMEGLETAIGALADVGIEACPLKGPVLAARLYPASVIRSCQDIDLLVRPQHFDRAVHALKRVGYGTQTGASAEYLRAHSHHLSLSRAGMAPIELHFRAYAGFGVVLSSDFLLDRAKPFELTPTLSVLTPSPEDECLYLAAHAAGHSFIRLVWLYDLKLLLRLHPSLDWERIAHNAAALGLATAVGYTTRLLRDWLGVSLESLPARFDDRSVRAVIADRLLLDVSRPQPVSVVDNLGGLCFTSLLCDRMASSAWLLQHHLLRSTRRRLKHVAPDYLPERWSA